MNTNKLFLLFNQPSIYRNWIWCIWCNLAVFLPSWTSWNLHEKNSATFGSLDGCQEVFLMRHYWCFSVCWFEWMQNYFLYYMSMFYVHIHHIATMFPFNLRITPRRSGRSCDNKRFQMGCIAADRFGLGFLPKWWKSWSFLVVLPHEWNEVWSNESSAGWSM